MLAFFRLLATASVACVALGTVLRDAFFSNRCFLIWRSDLVCSLLASILWIGAEVRETSVARDRI